MTIDSSPESLNTEQRKIYDTVVNQYTQELAVDQPESSQLLLHLDGPGGTGKTVALLTTCAKLQELAARLAMVRSGPDRGLFWRPFKKTRPYGPAPSDCSSVPKILDQTIRSGLFII